MSGKHIDLSELKIIKQYVSKKILKKKWLFHFFSFKSFFLYFKHFFCSY
jgi:hypothetical protein